MMHPTKIGQMMTIPAGAKTIGLPGFTLWFDQEGILCALSNKVPMLRLEEVKEVVALLKGYLGDQKKVCMLLDVTHSSETNREVRDFAAAELPKITKAIAIVSHSALGKMLANLFFSLNSQPYPVRYFTDETEARAWLKQYL